mmetsp:Transcript_2330/g.8539  ORF Transcript_2330/g.8539 Transcript_2330/m.8539 type:complete len:451 (-) Transcript_2330:929-2281(-)
MLLEVVVHPRPQKLWQRPFGILIELVELPPHGEQLGVDRPLAQRRNIKLVERLLKAREVRLRPHLRKEHADILLPDERARVAAHLALGVLALRVYGGGERDRAGEELLGAAAGDERRQVRVPEELLHLLERLEADRRRNLEHLLEHVRVLEKLLEARIVKDAALDGGGEVGVAHEALHLSQEREIIRDAVEQAFRERHRERRVDREPLRRLPERRVRRERAEQARVAPEQRIREQPQRLGRQLRHLPHQRRHRCHLLRRHAREHREQIPGRKERRAQRLERLRPERPELGSHVDKELELVRGHLCERGEQLSVAREERPREGGELVGREVGEREEEVGGELREQRRRSLELLAAEFAARRRRRSLLRRCLRCLNLALCLSERAVLRERAQRRRLNLALHRSHARLRLLRRSASILHLVQAPLLVHELERHRLHLVRPQRQQPRPQVIQRR